MEKAILQVRNLSKTYRVGDGWPKGRAKLLHAVSDVSFDVGERKTLGVVGESGCGKSTTGRLIMRLENPDRGQILFMGGDFLALRGRRLKRARKEIQMVFQDPYSTLNPQMTIVDNVRYPLLVHGVPPREAREQALDMLERVGISRRLAVQYPDGLSGGQRQRVAIARALVLRPSFVIADEPVSALDKSIQAQVLNLLEELKENFALSMMFISHDLSVIEYISDYVMVMYLGKVVEYGPTAEVYDKPLHPYTQALIQASPSLSRGRKSLIGVIQGEIPSPLDPPSGCRFRTRCPYATARCAAEEPAPTPVGGDRTVACFLHPDSDSAGRVRTLG